MDIGFVEQNVDVEAERLFRRVATDVTGNRCLTSSSLPGRRLNFDAGQVETRDLGQSKKKFLAMRQGILTETVYHSSRR